MANVFPSESPFWWPLDLSEREAEAAVEFRRRMVDEPVALDVPLADSVSDRLTSLMRRHVAAIIERDSLPHLGHVLNGWGDVKFKGARLTHRLGSFIHRGGGGEYLILQCDPEGEFHPWQGIAYALMAGVDPDEPLPPGVTLGELANNSRYIRTREGHELGHMLFALAYLDPDIGGRPFSLGGETRDVPALMEMAVEAHHYGSFEVCRKFHLTEGLCAMAARVAGLERYRADAQGFLNGQLDMMLLLGVILHEARGLAEAGRGAEPGILIQELRDTLVLDSYLENHCYYAGHIFELAGFAESLGYNIAPEYRSAMFFVANELNRTMPPYLPHAYFPECFLHLGHYRRGVTLLAELERLRPLGLPLMPSDLARFTADLDAAPDADEPTHAPPPKPPEGVYELASFSVNPRADFTEVVEQYRSDAPAHLPPRGIDEVFRRVIPAGWPRALHYELIDYGGPVGAELHLESDDVRPLAGRVRALTERVARRFPGRRVEWEAEWYEGCGRLRVIFDGDSPKETIAEGMSALIAETFDELDAHAKSLRVG